LKTWIKSYKIVSFVILSIQCTNQSPLLLFFGARVNMGCILNTFVLLSQTFSIYA